MRNFRARVLVLLVPACSCLLGATAAQGQTPYGTAQVLARTVEARAGEGRYDEAIVLFEKAYGLEPDPALLYNIGRCQERKGDDPRAREYYERYVGEEKDPDRLARGRQRLAEVLARLQEARVGEARPPGEATVHDVAPIPSVSAPRTADAVPAAAPVRRTPGPGRVPEPVSAAKGTPARYSPWQWVALGSGAAMVITGGVLTGLAARNRTKVDDAVIFSAGSVNVSGMSRADADSLLASADRMTDASIAMYSIGGAVIITGVVLAILDARKTPTRNSGPAPVALSAGPVPGGAMIGATGRF